MTEEELKLVRETRLLVEDSNKVMGEMLKDIRTRDSIIFWQRLILVVLLAILISQSITHTHF
jgi:hypothetical protein